MLKSLLSITLLAATSFPAMAVVAVQTPPPAISEEEKILSLPYQFYYFATETDGDGVTQERLHCYYPVTGVDVTLDIETYMPDPVNDVWYIPESDSVVLVIEEGGTELRQLYVYLIGPDNEADLKFSLSGMKACALNDYSTDDDAYVARRDGRVEIHGYDTDRERMVHGLYTLSLTPYLLPYPSQMKLHPASLAFFRVTSPDVNVRRSPEASAPRMGYWRCGECEYSDMPNTVGWEDERQTPPFTPWHPDPEETLYCLGSHPAADGWHPVVGPDDALGYVASRFVQEVPTVALSADRPLASPWLTSSVLTVRDGKYAGLWVYLLEDGMEEGGVYFGKLVDGKVLFYGVAPYPSSDVAGERTERFAVDADGTPWFGSACARQDEWGGNVFDISRLSEEEFDMLFALGRLNEGKWPVLVGLPSSETIIWVCP